MNERVWLQAVSPLVNKFRAVVAGFFLAGILTACSGGDGEMSPEAAAPENTATSTSSRSEVRAIWSSVPLDYYLVSLAIAADETGSPVVTALGRKADGASRLMSFDADAAQTATSSDDTGHISRIARGNPLVIGEETFMAHPIRLMDGGLSVALASPRLGVIGEAGISGSPRVAQICASATSDVFSFTLETDPVLVRGQIVEVNDALAFTEQGRMTFTGDIQSCAVMGANAIIQSGDSFTLLNGDGSKEHGQAGAGSTLEIVEHDDRLLLLWPTADGKIAARWADSEADTWTMTVTDGLTSRAPDRVTSITASSDVSTVNYPDGLIALTGHFSDGDPRLTYVSLRDVIQADPDWVAPVDTPSESG